MHTAIFGTTGSGKSYDMGALLEKLVEIEAKDNRRISMPVLIIDANGDYLDYVDKFAEENSLGACPTVTRYVFPNSPELGLRRSHIKPIGLALKV
jgi:DNA helicase HerA-like ATPase